jgi:hypothetical protein
MAAKAGIHLLPFRRVYWRKGAWTLACAKVTMRGYEQLPAGSAVPAVSATALAVRVSGTGMRTGNMAAVL